MLAQVLVRRYEVEIIGPTLWGQGVWEPCDTDEFNHKIIEWKGLKTLYKSTSELLDSVTGSVIYALKPTYTSFGVALLHKLKRKTPVILDIDDWEVGFLTERWRWRKKSLVTGSDIPLATLILDKCVGWADDVTVTSSFLERKYGGIRITHARDVELFNPARYNSRLLRSKHGIDNSQKIIMFLGSLEIYKGLEDLLQSIQVISRKDVQVIIVGVDKETPYVRKLMSLGKNQLRLEGKVPFTQIPEWLSMSDLVVLPQRNSPGAIGQVPAKIFDAMAMAKPIISTSVNDIPEILEGCGVIVEPGNVWQLAEEINYLLGHEEEARTLGIKARERCIEKYSYDVMEKTLSNIFDKYA